MQTGKCHPYAVGLPEIVYPAVEEFGRETQERCLLHWARTKTQVFVWEGNLPPGTPEGLSLAGVSSTMAWSATGCLWAVTDTWLSSYGGSQRR